MPPLRVSFFSAFCVVRDTNIEKRGCRQIQLVGTVYRIPVQVPNRRLTHTASWPVAFLGPMPRETGQLTKLKGVSKSTIQKYIYEMRNPGLPTQTWATFLRNHAIEIWACDFLQTYELFFRSLFVFVIVDLGSRRLVHFGVTRNPTDAWLAQQLREATPLAQGPRFLIRDNDSKYGAAFARVPAGTGIEVLRTPYRAPRANAVCERFLDSVQRQCLDHILILGDRHLHRVMREYERCTSTTRDPIRA